jgi:hypothetical protein
MKDRLIQKLAAIKANRAGRTFVLADAKDADMAFGIASPGPHYPAVEANRGMRTMPQFLDQIRAIVHQGEVDILLASASVMSRLAHAEGLFDGSSVTPAIRANDTTDVWVGRGARYRNSPSRPFATAYIEDALYGTSAPATNAKPVVDLGLYSMTFNNDLDADREALTAFKAFRRDAKRLGFHYFLEVFGPNVEATGIPPAEVGFYVNDMIVRSLAGVSVADQPLFLKIPYFGPAALEELVAYDPSLIVGILGGSAGTTYDAFLLLEEAQKRGARVALFGRKIKDAEDPLAFISTMRRVVDGDLKAHDACAYYHDLLRQQKIQPKRSLTDDQQTTAQELSYARAK